MLAGVEQVDDLGARELRGGDVPDPGGAVADDGELADVIAPRRMPSASARFPNVAAGSKVAMTLVGPVADRVAVLVEPVLGEEDGELDLAGACTAVLALAVRLRFLEVIGTPVPSMTA